LRGRASRQGDPGETRFFLSLEDDIMRLFGSERVMGMMEKLGVDEDTPLEQKMLTNGIENAQRQVESRTFQTRKSVLEYDDVMNTQREVIYKQRRQVLDGEDLQQSIRKMLLTSIESAVQGHAGENGHLDADGWKAATEHFRGVFLGGAELWYNDEELSHKSVDDLIGELTEKAVSLYDKKEQELGSPLMRELERVIMLRVVDEYWMDHIDAMTELRQGIGLRAYGQNNPVIEYKREGYDMFEEMVAAIQEETVRRIFQARVRPQGEVKRERVAKITGESAGGDGTVQKRPVVRKGIKIGRNDPCPCGSGKKWKKCDCKEYHSEENM
ncbi:MAG: SEC-C domain-containing protein, partial [Oscillospiraceae bacterium]|nr:SEC-C domain-containing protein [Oscillospiraceae bacterium]